MRNSKDYQPSLVRQVAEKTGAADQVRTQFANYEKFVEQVTKQDLIEAIYAAHDSMLTQCMSNPVKNAWGKEVDMRLINDMYSLAMKAKKEIV